MIMTSFIILEKNNVTNDILLMVTYEARVRQFGRHTYIGYCWGTSTAACVPQAYPIFSKKKKKKSRYGRD